MTAISPTTTPPTLQDDEQVVIGLALAGSNPDDLTITSASWTGDSILTVTPAEDTLTATAVATVGTDGTSTISVVATLSDGSTLSASAEVPVEAESVPLTLVIVFGTPTVTEGS